MRIGPGIGLSSVSPGASGPAFPVVSGSLVSRFDPSNAPSVTSSSNLASQVNNLTGSAGALVQATGAKQPAYGLTTLNSLNTLDCTANRFMVSTLAAGLTDFTWQGVIVLGAAVSGAYAVAGLATLGVVIQINAGKVRFVDYASGTLVTLFTDLVVTAGSSHIVSVKRIGTAVNAWLDATKSSVNGTAGTTTTSTSWVQGNDDATNSVDPFTGLYGDTLLYNVGLSDSNVIVNQAALKAKWNTP